MSGPSARVKTARFEPARPLAGMLVSSPNQLGYSPCAAGKSFIMRRRDFITLLGGATAWPLAARAQQGERVRRIGVLMASTADDPESQARIAAFAQALKQLGWTDGRNLRIDTRWATSNADDLRRHAAELAALAPDVIQPFSAQAVLEHRKPSRIAARPRQARDETGTDRIDDNHEHDRHGAGRL
jgi:hypothetical protein